MKTNLTTKFTNKSNSPLYFKYAIRLVKTTPSQILGTSPLKHITTPPNVNFAKKFINNSFSHNRSFDKTFIKGKFYKALNANLIYSTRKVNYINIKYKDDDSFPKQIYLNKKNTFNTGTKDNLNLLRSVQNTFRYEDMFITPEEFLQKKFTPKEIDVIFKNPSSFNLNSEPFKDFKLKVCKSLTDILNRENISKCFNNNGKHQTQHGKSKTKPLSSHYASVCNSSSNYFNSSTVTTRSNNTPHINKNIVQYAKHIKPLVISKPTTPHVNSFTCKHSGKSQSLQLKTLLHKQTIYENNRIQYHHYKQEKLSYKELLLQGKTNIQKQKILKNTRDLLYTYNISKKIQHNYHTLSS